MPHLYSVLITNPEVELNKNQLKTCVFSGLVIETDLSQMLSADTCNNDLLACKYACHCSQLFMWPTRVDRLMYLYIAHQIGDGVLVFIESGVGVPVITPTCTVQ